jgi:hypothetical protein
MHDQMDMNEQETEAKRDAALRVALSGKHNLKKKANPKKKPKKRVLSSSVSAKAS